MIVRRNEAKDLFARLLDGIEDQCSVPLVQTCCGLVENEDSRSFEKAARDRDPLLLSTREAGDGDVELIENPKSLQGFAHPSFIGGYEKHVFFDGSIFQKVPFLEDVAKRLPKPFRFLTIRVD